MNSTLVDYARRYVKAGFYVFPLYVKQGTNGKKDVRPAVLWRQASSNSLADVEAWWGEDGGHPTAGIGIDCGRSGLVVVDCDGLDGIANWEALGAPGTYNVSTPGGGIHAYYRADPAVLIGNDQDGTVATSVDIRGLGGLVIAAPTTDWRGTYEWLDEPDLASLPTVPAVVIERMRARRTATAPPATAAAAADPEIDVDDDLFAPARREFTVEQAKAFIKDAHTKLAGRTRGLNGAINDFAMACAHFPWLVDRAHCGRLVISALGEREGWTEPDDQDRKTIGSAYLATEAGRSWVAVKVTPAEVSAETTAPVLPPPAQPLKVARALIEGMERTDGHTHRAWWRGDFYAWTGAHWAVEELPAVEQWLYRQTGDATFLRPGKEDGEFTPEPWAPTKKKIGDLVHALGVGELQRRADEDHALATVNGVVVGRELRPHTPGRFNLFSLPFDYEIGRASCRERV